MLTSATLPANARANSVSRTQPSTSMSEAHSTESNALLYCPTHLPDHALTASDPPNTEIEALAPPAAHTRPLHLVLSCGSCRHGSTAGCPGRSSCRVMAPSALRQFIEDKPTSLFATMSFWQGVDAPGSTCRLVIIDRLPFHDPTIRSSKPPRPCRQGGVPGEIDLELPPCWPRAQDA